MSAVPDAVGAGPALPVRKRSIQRSRRWALVWAYFFLILFAVFFLTPPLHMLITSLKSLYDPAAVRDPRELGLLSDDGRRLLRRSVTGEEAEPDIDPADVIPDEPPIQDQESE